MKRMLKRMLAILLMLGTLVAAVPQQVKAGDAIDFSHVFDAVYYAQMNPHVVLLVGNDANALLEHFKSSGMKEGRISSPEFDVRAYADRYEDLRATFGDDYEKYYYHYIGFGRAEGRIGTTSGEAYGQADTQTTGSIDTSLVTEDQVRKYFSETLFVGDSIMTGYTNHVMRSGDPCEKAARIHACVSYSVIHALLPVTNGSVHPLCNGRKMNPMQVLEISPDVKHVFIFLSANALVCKDPEQVIQKYMVFIDKMKAVRPGIDFHLISQTYVYPGASKGALNNPSIAYFNFRLQEIANAYGFGYVDIATPLSDGNGNLPPAYCSDRLCHLQPAAYEIWTKVFHEYVRGVIAADNAL